MTIPTYLTIDLETVPDLEPARLLVPGGKNMTKEQLRLELGNLYARPGEEGGSAWIKSALHKIVAIGFQSLQEDGAPIEEAAAIIEPENERRALEAFDRMLEDRPVLVTFNGSAYDLPVLRYRALATGTSMPNFLSSMRPRSRGQGGSVDYFYRYGPAHIDLMDRLCSYGAATRPSLAEAAALIGLQAKDGVDGGDVERLAADGDWSRISSYVRRDVEVTTALFRAFLAMSEPISRPPASSASPSFHRGHRPAANRGFR